MANILHQQLSLCFVMHCVDFLLGPVSFKIDHANSVFSSQSSSAVQSVHQCRAVSPAVPCSHSISALQSVHQCRAVNAVVKYIIYDKLLSCYKACCAV